MERFPLILTVGELKRNGKELLNTVDYFETYWPAFNYSCAFSKTVEPIDTQADYSSPSGKTNKYFSFKIFIKRNSKNMLDAVLLYLNYQHLLKVLGNTVGLRPIQNQPLSLTLIFISFLCHYFSYWNLLS